MAYEDHQAQAASRSVACAIVTCSDTRTPDNDTSGQLVKTLLEDAGHEVAFYDIQKDEPAGIRLILKQLTRREDIQAIIFNGGTGVSRRDNTYDAVSEQLTKTLPGFGEIFRLLSYQSIGSGAILSRATAGIITTTGKYAPATGEFARDRHTVIFSIPGSPNAVELAMRELILKELSHLVWETIR
jgi:molybdenum cofactor biosynthesis protein B